MHQLTSTNKIVIIDFDDSFTFNIASEIYFYFKNVEVVPHHLFFSELINKYIIEDHQNHWGIILGPGPGHPKEYNKYHGDIEKLMKSPNVYLMGICLGHQIIAEIFQYEVVSSKVLKHGETELIDYQNIKLRVQRYNSLVPLSKNTKLESLVIEDEVYIFKGPQLVSYQFHPESVGTENSAIFFKEIIDFVKAI